MTLIVMVHVTVVDGLSNADTAKQIHVSVGSRVPAAKRAGLLENRPS